VAGPAPPALVSRAVEHLAARLAAIPGVVAVTLGGSRATNTAVEGSDWDFGLYYRGRLDPADIVALGWPGRVFAPGEWGQIVNGGAWLTVRLAAGALHFAEVHAGRRDRVACMANLGQAVLATAQGRLAAAGEWVLNEKRIIERAGLHAVQDRLGPPERDLGAVVSDVRACLELTDAVW
jgi:hypothetical protein